MKDLSSERFLLKNGSKIAVIGGGPAGSFFSYFALDYAERLGKAISIDIYEPKDFNCTGPAGCNNCGGIVSESLIHALSTEGLVLSSNVIRRGIESYTLHLEQGSALIKTPFKEQRIAAMFRGLGPLGYENNNLESFDNYLLDLCKKNGAKVIHERVTNAFRTKDGVTLTTGGEQETRYDLVVGAVGLNAKALDIFQSICPSFEPPITTKTYISEFKMEPEVVDAYFGNSMHVFLLNIPHIKFGALIPKGCYVTLVLLGSDINKEIASSFVHSEAVRKLFPPEINLDDITPCKCYPSINVKGAKLAYDDRVVLVGDSASSKLYKNGIGAAYITGKAAANTALFNGISSASFRKHYQPACTNLDRDNILGKLIFAVTGIIQKSHFLKAAMLGLVITEQGKKNSNRRMSAILWDTFTGSAAYRNIFLRFLNPLLIIPLIWSMIKNTFNLILERIHIL
jgi:flavin-dependent dehydrogenase